MALAGLLRPLGFALVLAAAGAARAGELSAALQEALKAGHAPAVGLLVMRDDAVVLTDAVGARRLDAPGAVRASDVWHIGSDAKPMTATLIARLVERGTLSWTARLDQMLPDLAATMRPEYRAVTLVDLLSHRSGLPHDVTDEAFLVSLAKDGRPTPALRRALVARALQEAPVAPPGTAFHYSNTGFILAAVIAERATGASYEALMRREVFDPLGVTSEGIGAPKGDEPRGHMDGKPVLDTAEVNPDFYAPAGDWYLSLGDWAKFCLDQMRGVHGRGRLLKTETYRLLQTPVAEAGDSRIALGWGVATRAAGYAGDFLTHAGSDGSWYAAAALEPRTLSGVLAAANAGADMGGDKVVRAAMRAGLGYLGAPLAPEAPEAKAASPGSCR